MVGKTVQANCSHLSKNSYKNIISEMKNKYYLIPNLWKSKAREHGLCMAWLILKPIVWIWNASIVLEILTGLNSRQGFSFYALKRCFNNMPYITTFLLASPIFMLTCIYPGRQQESLANKARSRPKWAKTVGPPRTNTFPIPFRWCTLVLRLISPTMDIIIPPNLLPPCHC